MHSKFCVPAVLGWLGERAPPLDRVVRVEGRSLRTDTYVRQILSPIDHVVNPSSEIFAPSGTGDLPLKKTPPTVEWGLKDSDGFPCRANGSLTSPQDGRNDIYPSSALGPGAVYLYGTVYRCMHTMSPISSVFQLHSRPPEFECPNSETPHMNLPSRVSHRGVGYVNAPEGQYWHKGFSFGKRCGFRWAWLMGQRIVAVVRGKLGGKASFRRGV